MAALVATTAVLFSSCSKELDLKGTTWTGTYSSTEVDAEWGSMSITTNNTLNFTTEKDGTMEMIGKVTLSNEGETETFPVKTIYKFTYSVNENTVKMTGTYSDVDGYTEKMDVLAVANDKHNELTITVEGTKLVFKKK